MRRLGVIVALGALLGMFAGVVTASPAMAGRGHKWQMETPKSFTLPALCPFKVRVTFPVGKEFTKLLKASDGSMTTLTTGSLKVTYTNLSTGKAITENESGPGKATTHPDGSVTVRSTGHNGVFLSPADAQRFGLPTVGVTAGPLTASFNASGQLTSLSLHGGHVLVDVCAALS
jgi:hypothetical protein